MPLERVYVCTSKQANLYRIYRLQTGDQEKQQIFSAFSEDLEVKKISEIDMEAYNQNSLIQDIPYTINFSDIIEDSYLNSFKTAIEKLLEDGSDSIIQFGRFGHLNGEIRNFEPNEGIKFLVVQDEEALYFLSISVNGIIKNKPVISISVTEDTTVFNVPKGIQVPPAITARLSRIDEKLFVYDVNRFEKMLTLNENLKAKSHAVIQNFQNGAYTISNEEYKFVGLDVDSVKSALFSSARAVRRLAKYNNDESEYTIAQIKNAVNKLDEDIRVKFNDETKTIEVTPNTAKTFVGIIHNSIVQRLISGDVEITI